jgi:hypothetical protein
VVPADSWFRELHRRQEYGDRNLLARADLLPGDRQASLAGHEEQIENAKKGLKAIQHDIAAGDP